ncbi:unnamed protein product [Auanema sp. JU1783]|nr:unnamed protein product [Auanema sp. JU1783]
MEAIVTRLKTVTQCSNQRDSPARLIGLSLSLCWMVLMNKPASQAITTYSPFKPVIVFVAPRRQTRLTAMSFISHLVSQGNPKQWFHMEEHELEMHLMTINMIT